MDTTVKSVRVQFDKVLGETAAAVLLQFGRKEIWFPKKLCRGRVVNNKLGGNMVIPAWLYVDKFNQQPPIEQAVDIVETHVPQRIEPINTTPDAELTRQPIQGH